MLYCSVYITTAISGGESMSYKILIVDNETADLEVTRMILSEDPDFDITTSLDSDEAIRLVKEKPFYFSVVLLDYRMPKDGIQTAKEMLEINPHLIIALLSADDSREVLKKCLAINVCDFIEKNQDEEVVLGVVRSLCQRWEDNAEIYDHNLSETDNQKIIESIGIVGKSNEMVKVAQLVKRASKSSCNVFISGESGTGKELIAQAIHKLSERKNKPFVGINVNAIPENLVESHLFGHKKGSFTGAHSDSEGLIKSAHQGTLFLDEIGDLKPDLQVKLLRVIQERKFTPVGATKPIDVDIRIISATHVNLEKAILKGSFREDLYYRLHVMPIRIPSLRDRTDDIAPLFQHFLKLNKSEDTIVLKKTMRCLETYSWKGNVRELQNEVERLVAERKTRIMPEDLNINIKSLLNLEIKEVETPNYQDFMRKHYETELEYIQQSIKKVGSIKDASRMILNLPASTVSSRIKILEKNILNSIHKNEGN